MADCPADVVVNPRLPETVPTAVGAGVGTGVGATVVVVSTGVVVAGELTTVVDSAGVVATVVVSVRIVG